MFRFAVPASHPMFEVQICFATLPRFNLKIAAQGVCML